MPAKPRPPSLSTPATERRQLLAPVAATGDRRATLEALRDHLAGAIDRLTDRQVIHLTPLSKRLDEVTAELEALPTPVGASRTDDLAAARAARRATAARTQGATATQ